MGLVTNDKVLIADDDQAILDSTALVVESLGYRAVRVADAVRDNTGGSLKRETEVNSLFATLPAALIPRLQDRSFFWMWDETAHEVRWMTAFDTAPTDIETFAAMLREELASVS